MHLPPLYAILNITPTHRDVEKRLSSLAKAGVRLFQLRMKGLSNEEMSALASEAMETARRLRNGDHTELRVLINDSVEVCRAVSADGVHLGQEDSSPMEARSALGPDSIIGLSTHNLSQVTAAPFNVLSYVALGPIFTSPTKSGHAPEVGLDQLRLATTQTTLPIVAIGGVTSKNVQGVYLAGAKSAAAISDLALAPDLAERVREYSDAFESARREAEAAKISY